MARLNSARIIAGRITAGRVTARHIGLSDSIAVINPRVELPDGVWNPADGTWLKSISQFVDFDRRVNVVNGVQSPFSDIAEANAEGMRPIFRSGDYLSGITDIAEFTAPLGIVPIGDSLVVMLFAGGSRLEITRSVELGPNLIGVMELVSGNPETRTFLSWVLGGSTFRWVSAIRQVDDKIYQYQSIDGGPTALTVSPLPAGYIVDRSPVLINSNLNNFVYGVSEGWPFGDTIPLASDEITAWLPGSSHRGGSAQQLGVLLMWPQFVAAANSDAVNSVETQTLEPDTSFDYTAYAIQSTVGGAAVTPHGNGEFDAWNASYSIYKNSYPSKPKVNKIIITSMTTDRSIFVITINPDVAATVVTDQTVEPITHTYTFDDPINLSDIKFQETYSQRSRVTKCKILGPTPILSNGVPVLSNGEFVYGD